MAPYGGNRQDTNPANESGYAAPVRFAGRIKSVTVAGAGAQAFSNIVLTPAAATTALVIAQPTSTLADAIVVSGGSLTGSTAHDILNLSQLWNTSGVVTAIALNITETASGAGSKLLDLMVNSASVFTVGSGNNSNLLTLAPSNSQTALLVNQGTAINGTALLIQSGTVTGLVSLPGIAIGQTWNTTGNPTLIFANVTNTASNVGSRLIDLQVGGNTRFFVSVQGIATFTPSAGNAGVFITQAAGGVGLTLTQQASMTADAIQVVSGTLGGSAANSILNLAQTWNTSGNPTAILLNLTNTASGATAKLLDLQIASSSYMSVDKNGTLKLSRALVNALDLSAGQGNIAYGQKVFTISGAGTTTPTGIACYTQLNFTGAVTQTIAAPNPSPNAGTIMIFEIFGNAVAPGVITWNAVYKFAAATAPTNPASGKRRYVAFLCIDGTNLEELFRSTGDI